MKNFDKIKEAAIQCLADRQAKQVTMPWLEIKEGDIIVTNLNTLYSEYFEYNYYNKEEFSTHISFVLKLNDNKLTPIPQFSFKDTEGEIKIFNENDEFIYKGLRSAMFQVKKAASNFVKDNLGIKGEVFLGTIQTYTNQKELDKFSLEIVENAGFSENKTDDVYTFKTPIYTYEFIYLLETGQDNLEDVCSNKYGVLIKTETPKY